MMASHAMQAVLLEVREGEREKEAPLYIQGGLS